MSAPIRNHAHVRLIRRRSIFLGAAASLFCAPAIVRATSLMLARNFISATREELYPGPQYAGFVDRLRYHYLESALMSGWEDSQRRGSAVRGISESDAIRAVAHAYAQGWLKGPSIFGTVIK